MTLPELVEGGAELRQAQPSQTCIVTTSITVYFERGTDKTRYLKQK